MKLCPTLYMNSPKPTKMMGYAKDEMHIMQNLTHYALLSKNSVNDRYFHSLSTPINCWRKQCIALARLSA